MHGEKKSWESCSLKQMPTPMSVQNLSPTTAAPRPSGWMLASSEQSNSPVRKEIQVLPSKPCPDLFRKDSFTFPLLHRVRGS